MHTAVKHPVPDRVKTAICNFLTSGTLTLRAECQSALMSKITNNNSAQDDLQLYTYGNSGRQRVHIYND